MGMFHGTCALTRTPILGEELCLSIATQPPRLASTAEIADAVSSTTIELRKQNPMTHFRWVEIEPYNLYGSVGNRYLFDGIDNPSEGVVQFHTLVAFAPFCELIGWDRGTRFEDDAERIDAVQRLTSFCNACRVELAQPGRVGNQFASDDNWKGMQRLLLVTSQRQVDITGYVNQEDLTQGLFQII